VSTAPTDVDTVDPEQPWLGLAAFSEATRGYFFGRDGDIAELCRRVQRNALTTLYGQSGLGKTSILNAGVAPRLRAAGYCPVYLRMDYAAVERPAEQLKQALLRATADMGQWTRTGSATPGESLWEFLHHRDDLLQDETGRQLVPLLIFDQFEEVFSLGQTDSSGRRRAAEFLEQLADLVENRPPRALEALLEQDDTVAVNFDFSRSDYRVLIALREDYLAHYESLRSTMPSVTQNRLRLARMTGAQALEAVVRPGGRLVSRGVAEAIVQFVAGSTDLDNAEVEPSLLSLICRELNNSRLVQGRAEIGAELLAGSRDAILVDFYTRALSDQPPPVRAVIEDHLLTDSGYRENLAEERMLKLLEVAGAVPEAAGCLATLVDRRLLRIEERLDVRRVELTHDVLCSVVQSSRRSRVDREAKERAERELVAQQSRAATTRAAFNRARTIAIGTSALALLAAGSAAFGIYSARRAATAEAEAINLRVISESSRAQAEQLAGFILDDLYEEVAPIGRIESIVGLSARTVEYYRGLPAAAQTPDTLRNCARACARLVMAYARLGRNDEAERLVAEARQALANLPQSETQTEATRLARSFVGAAEISILNNRGAMQEILAVGGKVLTDLKPLRSAPKPSAAALRLAATTEASIGFAYLRLLRFPESADVLAEARQLMIGLGGRDPDQSSIGVDYVRASWVHAEALLRLGRTSEAIDAARDSVQVADGLLAKVQGNLLALRGKAVALSIQAEIAEASLQFGRAAVRNNEAARAMETLLGLEPQESRNNLRLYRHEESRVLRELGRLPESWTRFAAALEVGKSERLGGFTLFNHVEHLSTGAIAASAEGRSAEANRLLQRAAAASAAFAIDNTDPAFRSFAEDRVTVARLTVASLEGRWSGVETELNELIRRRLTARSAAGSETPSGVDELLARSQGAAAEAAAVRGAHGVAERHARDELQEYQRQTNPTLGDQRRTHEARVRLALALARQGKTAEGTEILRPALQFFELPAVRRSDSVLLRGLHARTLLAAALLTPASRSNLLARATQQLEAMPPIVQQLRDVVRLRGEIDQARGASAAVVSVPAT
jgi:tetratricopeptide (TPR) repeat protein